MNLIEHVSSFIQEKDINNIYITLGKKIDTNIFNRNIADKYSIIYNKLINYHKKTIINKYYIYNNFILIKNDKENYIKQIEHDSSFIKYKDIDLFVKVCNNCSISQLDFPNQLEYDIEYINNEIHIKISDYIDVLFINNKYIQIHIIKNAYIDNTIEELDNFMKDLL
tara:strand:+ start:17846 stop:18346 length:501 start_codon:yes stop_codon:yes gene_type:complete